MGVARVEQADTHENRVVKDLLKRAIRASELYLREYRVHGNHFRVELVGGFLRTLRRQRQHSPIASVGSLVGIPGPNYVLQHDSRYSVLWQAYLQLVRHQDTLDSAWRWRDRVWSETVLLAVLSALRKDCGGFLNRNDALLHSEHVAGAYLDPAVALGPLTPSPNQRIDVLLGASQAKAYPGRLGGLAELFPDVLVISRPVDAVIPKRVVAIWAILDFSASSRLTAALAELARSAPKELAGLKLLAVVPGKGSAVGLPATVEVLSLPLPPQRGVAALGSTLKSALGFK
mgnify:CR=1 FL=1